MFFMSSLLIILMWWPLRRVKINLKNNIERFRKNIDEVTKDMEYSSPTLIDSIDLELINIIKQCNGDLLEIESQVNIVPLFPEADDFFQRIVKLNILHYITIDIQNLIVTLTSKSLDALNTPAIFFKTTIPPDISESLYTEKLSLINKNFTESIFKCSQICEKILKKHIIKYLEENEVKKTLIPSHVINNNFERTTLGELIGYARQIKLYKRNSLEDNSFSYINKIRNKIHISGDEKPEDIKPEDSYICDMLLEIILRKIYQINY